MKKHPTRLYFDLDLWEWLKAEAQRLRTSINQVVRTLILEEISRRKGQNDDH